MRTPRITAHPVMGWFVIILLATIATVPPVFFLVSPRAAQLVSLTGTVIAINFGLVAVLRDIRRRRM